MILGVQYAVVFFVLASVTTVLAAHGIAGLSVETARRPVISSVVLAIGSLLL